MPGSTTPYCGSPPSGVTAERDGDDLLIDVAAGEPWDDVVHAFVADGWSGIASLSGIPGRTGATPIQNVGAYGTEISAVLVDVTLHDRATGELRRVPATDLHLGYRTSMLRGTDAAVVLRVRLRLTRTPPPVRYAELARMLNVHSGDGAPPAEVRAAVLELRRGKGMVLDPADPDTRSVGSFFTNPILDYDQAEIVDRQIRARFGTDAHYPRYPAENGAKLSAAWLIERAGFPRGFALPGAPGAAISSKHTLALTNRGGSTADLLALARHIREGVDGRVRHRAARRTDPGRRAALDPASGRSVDVALTTMLREFTPTAATVESHCCEHQPRTRVPADGSMGIARVACQLDAYHQPQPPPLPGGRRCAFWLRTLPRRLRRSQRGGRHPDDHARTADRHRGVVSSAPTTTTSAEAAESTTSAAPQIRVIADPKLGSTDVGPLTPMTITTFNAKITDLTMTGADGGTVAGTVDASGAAWTLTDRLEYGQTYTIAGTATDSAGGTTPITGTIATVNPLATVPISFVQDEGGTFGVGQPVVIVFEGQVTNKSAGREAAQADHRQG